MRVLIIGLGSIGKKHVDALLKIEPEVEIFALRCGKNEEQYKTVRNIFSLPDTDVKFDFVIIANNTSLHERTIIDMLELGLPLFIEKPVLSNLENYDFIKSQIDQKKIITYVACNLRFHPALIYVYDYLQRDSLRINEVNIYCGSYLPEWRPAKNFRTIYSANKDMGGGVHLDLIHEVDYCTWLFGFPEKVYSNKTSKSSLQIDAIDNAKYIFSYPEFDVNILLNYYRRDAKRTIEIVTEEGTLSVDLLKNEIIDNRSMKCLHSGDYNFMDTYTQQMKYFINNLRDGKKMMNDFSYAANVLNLALYE